MKAVYWHFCVRTESLGEMSMHSTITTEECCMMMKS